MKMAAHFSGVPTKRYKLLVYTFSGFCAGIAGMVYSSQLSVGTPIAGEGYELDAIAAVVVGGTSLLGESVQYSGPLSVTFSSVCCEYTKSDWSGPIRSTGAKGASSSLRSFIHEPSYKDWK